MSRRRRTGSLRAVSGGCRHALTQFSFSLPSGGHARLTVVDLAGRVVATLADGPFTAGEHQARWTAAAPPGVYFARLDAPGGASRVTRVVRFE